MGFLNGMNGPFHALLRLMAGLLFMEHGTAKLLHFPPTEMFATAPAVGSIIWIAGVLELVGGALIALGLFTSPVAFVLSGEMAVAYFMAHFPQGFFPLVNQGEAAVLFCFIFLYLSAAGAGPFSVDAAMKKKA